MILIDSSLWVDHFRENAPTLHALLVDQKVLCHPFVVGEIMMGNPSNRDGIVTMLHDLPQAAIASDDEVLDFVERHRLYGRGIGYVDAHLLVAVQLTPRSALWTRDRRLFAAADHLNLTATDLPRLQ